MKRPKRTNVLVHSKTVEKVWYVHCPHCHTSCIGLQDYIDRMKCWKCDEIIMLVWSKEKELEYIIERKKK